MHKRIYAFLEKYDLLYSLQFGFRSKFSTSHALIHMTEAIRSALDSGNVTCGIFVDFAKAFDTVNHKILLKKLDNFGFRGVVNDWFRSYLTDRKQKVVINGFESKSKIMYHGVPQGSVLGPIHSPPSHCLLTHLAMLCNRRSEITKSPRRHRALATKCSQRVLNTSSSVVILPQLGLFLQTCPRDRKN